MRFPGSLNRSILHSGGECCKTVLFVVCIQEHLTSKTSFIKTNQAVKVASIVKLFDTPKVFLKWASTRENLSSLFVNNKDADQPACKLPSMLRVDAYFCQNSQPRVWLYLVT